jgi:hypothetical protein
MDLKEYFEAKKIKYTPWAKALEIPASCIHRHLQGRGNFDPLTAKTIHTATGGEVDLITLCPALADIING